LLAKKISKYKEDYI